MAICTALPGYAAGTVFSTMLGGSGEDYATALTSDAQGNTYVVGLAYSPDLPVTPGAYQTTIGGLYSPDAFVAKISPAGTILWATYLGGLIDDWASGVALDSAGNVWVTGATRSANFPVVNPIQSTLNDNGGATHNFNTFLAELSPDGSQLLFSTFLGGSNVNTPAAMVLDSANNIYLAINTNGTTGFQGIANGSSTNGIVVTKLSAKGALAYSFFHPSDTAEAMALDSSGAAYVAGTAPMRPYAGASGFAQAVVFKISPDGSTKLYEKTFGGSYSAIASAIAVDRAGEAWIAGSTQSTDFPLVHPLANQTTLGARPLWQSGSGGAAWTPIENLPFALPKVMVADPATPSALYEATGDLGVFKSVDAGATWTQSSTGIGATSVNALALDPVHAQTLYAATATAVYKSTNGAVNWSVIDSPALSVNQILIDLQNDNIVYESNGSIRKSTDGGNTWSSVPFPGSVTTLAVDPRASGHLFAISQMFYCGFFCTSNMPAHLYTSTDSGNTWTQLPPVPSNLGLLVDPSTNPSTVYDGLSYKSSDGGVTWTALPAPPFSANISALAVDPSGNLYAAVFASPIYVSHDRGQSWTALTSPTPTWTSVALGPKVISIVPAGSTGTLYTTVDSAGTAAFVAKFSADGSTLEYSTYLRGHSELDPIVSHAAEPATMLFQNWIDGIALDASGNVILAGGTRARDFPTVMPAQSAHAGGGDAFAAMISADGSTLKFSTAFGGSQDDGAFAVALDSAGNVILAGQTWSSDFPVTGATPAHFGLGDAFVVKLSTAVPSVSSVLNGASYQPGIATGSWAMITGSNLANSTRAWQDSDFSSNQLPTSLDGVSVTIDGKPAFVEYVSPTQINVQVPSDAAVGSVRVVVNNNGAVSAAFAVALQPAAPAFFMNADHTVVATDRSNNRISSSAPAVPGQTVVLFGTGFGATIPAVPAGVFVSGAPATPSLPTVTVGGVAAQVISSVLATGGAGLYWVTIQIPANAPIGQVAIQASIDGLQTQSGVTIAIATGAPSADDE